jgi:23S rRNA (guanosine2251-2'-O)-methyltransferase
MTEITIIAHDIRSTHNVGALLRTADGIGVQKVYFTGYTPYPKLQNDARLPHIAEKLTRQIHKTALGAEKSVAWEFTEDIKKLIAELKENNYQIVALEQHQKSISLVDYRPVQKIAILLGREVDGIDSDLLALCDCIVQIPMYGAKESFNVVQAAAMVLYHCRFMS